MLHSLNMYIYRFLSACSGMEANLIVWDKTIAEAAVCRCSVKGSLAMWQLETQDFTSPYI